MTEYEPPAGEESGHPPTPAEPSSAAAPSPDGEDAHAMLEKRKASVKEVLTLSAAAVAAILAVVEVVFGLPPALLALKQLLTKLLGG